VVAWTGSEVVVAPEEEPFLYFYNPTNDIWRRVMRHFRETPDEYYFCSPVVAGDFLLTIDGVYSLVENRWVAMGNESLNPLVSVWTGNELLLMQSYSGATPLARHTFSLIYPYTKD
jgi:hypothetical protein